jgi:hypothetical protein
MNDVEAFDHYDDPGKREPTSGVPHRRPDRLGTEHVPVRFPRETIRRVKRLADADGLTVSNWIRRTVDETVRQRDSAGGERTSS